MWRVWVRRGGVYRVLMGKSEGKRPLGRPRRRWVDNIRMDLQEVGCGYMDWIGRAQDRDRWRTLVSAVMNFWVPWNAGNFLTSCKPVTCSGRTLHHGVLLLLLLLCTWKIQNRPKIIIIVVIIIIVDAAAAATAAVVVPLVPSMASWCAQGQIKLHFTLCVNLKTRIHYKTFGPTKKKLLKTQNIFTYFHITVRGKQRQFVS